MLRNSRNPGFTRSTDKEHVPRSVPIPTRVRVGQLCLFPSLSWRDHMPGDFRGAFEGCEPPSLTTAPRLQASPVFSIWRTSVLWSTMVTGGI